MDFQPGYLSCKPAPVRPQTSCSAADILDFEAGLHKPLVWALRRMSARLALPGHVPGLAALAQNRPGTEQEWQSEP